MESKDAKEAVYVLFYTAFFLAWTYFVILVFG